MADEDLHQPLKPSENKAVREMLKERDRRKWLLAMLAKLSTIFPWAAGGLFFLSQGDWLGALKWWK